MKKILFLFISLSIFSFEINIKVLSQRTPIDLASITISLFSERNTPQLDSNNFPIPNTPYIVTPSTTYFTNNMGIAHFSFSPNLANYEYRIKIFKPGFKIINEELKALGGTKEYIIEKITDAKELADQYPSNTWLGSLNLQSEENKKTFKMQCGFCHQQGSEYTRADRTAEDWSTTIKRMVRYGSRLPSEQQKALPEILVNAYKSLQLNPESITPPNPWEEHLQHTKIMQWDIGNSMSQTHDLLVVPNQPLISNTTVYVADNIQDRLYEIILPENKVTIYKIPHLNTDQPGGLISARLRDFPQHDSTSNAHSLARSLVDGHIFITPSAQQRLIEFDPAKKNFKIHQMTRGFYPHTIRIDKQDRVWFTLALSNQVAMYDRLKNTFTYYDLPARSFSEKIITKNIYWIFKLMSWGLPISNWLPISKDYNGTPLVYGIDTDSNNLIWFARLHTNEIGFINPSTHLIQLIKTPFTGPRRLRADKNGNIWITSFGDSLIAKYDISSKKFTLYPMPVKPSGSETPYSVNIDHDRHLVWVTGNQSNAIYSFNVVSEKWKTYPLPRNITFTRDIELDTEGNAYAANSNFPSWQIEDGQPSMIKIMPTINK